MDPDLGCLGPVHGEVMLSFGLGAAVSSNGGIPVSNRHIKVAIVGKIVSRTA